MLQADEKQQKQIMLMLGEHTDVMYALDTGVRIESYMSYDDMAKIIDFLRSVNKTKIDLSIVSPQMLEPVKVWLSYKKEKGQSYKPTGFKTFYKKLCEMSNNDSQTALAIIEQSMQNNYAGIFPLRVNNNGNTRTTIGMQQFSAKAAADAAAAASLAQSARDWLDGKLPY